MTSFELQIPRHDAPARGEEPRRTYLAEGRRAVRDWMTARVRGPDADAEIATALRLGLVPARLVALWAAEDLFADPAMELAARAGYPTLDGAFAALDRERRDAAMREQAQRAERDLRHALEVLGH